MASKPLKRWRGVCWRESETGFGVPRNDAANPCQRYCSKIATTPSRQLRHFFSFSTRSPTGMNTNALPMRSLRISFSLTNASRSERAVW